MPIMLSLLAVLVNYVLAALRVPLMCCARVVFGQWCMGVALPYVYSRVVCGHSLVGVVFFGVGVHVCSLFSVIGHFEWVGVL